MVNAISGKVLSPSAAEEEATTAEEANLAKEAAPAIDYSPIPIKIS
jgi:hypothetical protein